MARPREHVHLFACPTCAQHWWTREDVANPGHVCPNDEPSGGIDLGLYEEVGHPQSEGE